MRVQEPTYLFVYGTLRKGFAHPVKREIKDDVEWIGETFIRGRLFDIGKYPGALRIDETKRGCIKGEVLKLTHPRKVFRILDQYEGFNANAPEDSEYRRDLELVRMPDGKEIKAWVYWYNVNVQGKRRIRNQDYLDYLKKKSSI